MTKAQGDVLENALAVIMEQKGKLEDLAAVLNDTYDSKSERWQESDTGTEYKDQIDCLDIVVSECDTLVEDITTLLESV